MKRVFRFNIDLRERKKAPPGEAFELDEQTRLEQAWQADLERIAPAWLEPEDHHDRLTAMEHLEAYNASLARAQARPVGSYQEAGLQYEVAFEDDGSKRVVSLVVDRPWARVSQLLLSPDGNLTRWSLEHQAGPSLDLFALLPRGLDAFSAEDLCFYQGYLWICLAYEREEDQLVALTQVIRTCPVGSSHVELTEERLIG